MIILTNPSTTDILRVTCGTSVASIHIHCSWVDDNAGVVTPGNTQTIITSSTSATTVSPAVTSSHQTNIKTLVIHNISATATLITIDIQPISAGTAAVLMTYTLQPNETIQYFDTLGFEVLDAAGGRKVSPASGRLLAVTVKTSGTTFTSTAATTTLRVRCIASGGSGGGNPATASTAGSGGGAGGYVEKLYTAQTPGKTYTVAIGASVNGSSGAAGTIGQITTFTDGVTIITAQAGTAGLLAVASTSVAGGAASAVSTNGDLNGAGAAGENGISSATALQGGAGGNTPYGAGGGTSTTNATVGKSAAALGFGGGGGGSSTLATASAQAGGASGPGVIIIEEYS